MIKLHIAAPAKTAIKEEVKSVTIELVDGEIELLPNHIDFISLIRNGFVKFNDQKIDIEEGVVHFEENELYITYFK